MMFYTNHPDKLLSVLQNIIPVALFRSDDQAHVNTPYTVNENIFRCQSENRQTTSANTQQLSCCEVSNIDVWCQKLDELNDHHREAPWFSMMVLFYTSHLAHSIFFTKYSRAKLFLFREILSGLHLISPSVVSFLRDTSKLKILDPSNKIRRNSAVVLFRDTVLKCIDLKAVIQLL